jgi:hypothetical protein
MPSLGIRPELVATLVLKRPLLRVKVLELPIACLSHHYMQPTLRRTCGTRQGRRKVARLSVAYQPLWDRRMTSRATAPPNSFYGTCSPEQLHRRKVPRLSVAYQPLWDRRMTARVFATGQPGLPPQGSRRRFNALAQGTANRTFDWVSPSNGARSCWKTIGKH